MTMSSSSLAGISSTCMDDDTDDTVSNSPTPDREPDPHGFGDDVDNFDPATLERAPDPPKYREDFF